MLYMTCPTCGYFLGQKTLEFEEKKKEICSNPKMSKKEQEKNIAELLESLKFRRYCCKMRMMTYKDLVSEIIPVTENIK